MDEILKLVAAAIAGGTIGQILQYFSAKNKDERDDFSAIMERWEKFTVVIEAEKESYRKRLEEANDKYDKAMMEQKERDAVMLEKIEKLREEILELKEEIMRLETGNKSVLKKVSVR